MIEFDKMSIIELKAFAYDCFESMEIYKNNLLEANKMIQARKEEELAKQQAQKAQQGQQ